MFNVCDKSQKTSTLWTVIMYIEQTQFNMFFRNEGARVVIAAKVHPLIHVSSPVLPIQLKIHKVMKP